MPACAHQEPETFTAGETLTWSRHLPAYPSTSYTLKYALQAAGKSLITITATGNEDGTYTVAVTPDLTAAYAPGCYLWVAFVEGPGNPPVPRTVLARGTLSILQSPLAAFGSTHASRMLTLIEAALEGRIPNGLESTDIDGQRLDRIPAIDLQKMRDRYAAKVALEQKALAATMGQRVRNGFGIRFVRP